MKNIIYYIVVHDPVIITHFESIGKYKSIKNYKYLLVGTHDIDYSSDLIIQCNKLPINIEHYNHYLAYTAWWAVGKNSIGSEYDYIFFLEYDTDIINPTKIEEMEQNIVNSEYKMMGIAQLPIPEEWIYPDHPVCQLMGYNGEGNFWLITNNIIFEKQQFDEFINDPMLESVFDILNNQYKCGHILERYTTLYAITNDVPFGIISPVCLVHNQLDSHGTQNRQYLYQNFRNSIT